MQIDYVNCEISKTVFKIFLAVILRKLELGLWWKVDWLIFQSRVQKSANTQRKKERKKEKKKVRTDREIIKIQKMLGQKLYTNSPFGSLYKNNNATHFS